METEFNEEEFEFKMEKMMELFPKLKFSDNSDDYDILDEVLVPYNNAVVYYSYVCYCCCEDNEMFEKFEINRNHNITYRDFYEECELKWKYTPDEMGCNHHFLEGFKINKNVIIPEFGS